MKRNLTIILFLSLMLSAANGQEINRSGNFYISVNIVKIFMGMPNLELEYGVTDKISVYLFSEVNLLGRKLKERGHPDLVFRTGGRYHMLKSSDTRNDLHIGPYTGFTSVKNSGRKDFFIGADLGYRYRFSNAYYLFPRALVTYSFSDWQIIPGLELLTGRIL